MGTSRKHECYDCDLCQVTFGHKSKYDRHLESAAHKRRVMILFFEVEDDPISSCCDTNDSMELQHIESMAESEYFTPVSTWCIIILYRLLDLFDKIWQASLKWLITLFSEDIIHSMFATGWNALEWWGRRWRNIKWHCRLPFRLLIFVKTINTLY